MKIKLVFASLLLLGLLGCNQLAQEVSSTSNSAVKVELLFRYDGCSVYRFEDGLQLNSHYYVRCDKESNSSTSGTQWCGKNCTFTEIIQTVEV